MVKKIKNNLIAITLILTFTLFSVAQGVKPETHIINDPYTNASAFQPLSLNVTSQVAVATTWEVDELVKTAAHYINAYWREVFAANRLRYVAPTVYRSPRRIENALYLPSSHAIYYDYDFFNGQMAKHGDFAVVTILAHEWGHAIQTLMENQGHLSPNRYDIEKELKADCFAGSFARNESRTPRLEANDIAKALSSLMEAGDHQSISIYARNAHGTSQKRRTAFGNGFRYGVEGCACTSISTIAVAAR
jgi:uncharacterized protein